MRNKNSDRQPDRRRLEHRVFPKHKVSVRDLQEKYRDVLWEAIGNVNKKLLTHIRGCKHCQEQLQLLEQTDPLWSAKNDLQKVLVQIASKL